MRRYISNYTILASGEERVNHITTLDDDGKLISIEPFDRELGNTLYVPIPLCVALAGSVEQIIEVFQRSASRRQFKQLLAATHLSWPQDGVMTVLALDFAHNSTKQL